MATVLITGGTGMVGRALTERLTSAGYDVIILSRQADKQGGKGVTYAQWNVEEGTIDTAALQSADYIVHLAGAGVADKRWTRERKQEIEKSRTQSGALLVKALQQTPNKVQAVISASAIGWYGEDKTIPNPQPFTETDPPDDSFLGETCRKWEASIAPVSSNKRLVIYRIGIVLSNEGGAYKEFKKPLQFGTASILGSGKQIISWIHIDDLTRLLLFAIENKALQGVYNAVAPQPVSNKDLVLKMGAQKGFYIPVPVPAFALKVALGEMSIEVLKSATVSSQKIEAEGFTFQYPTVDEAVRQLK